MPNCVGDVDNILREVDILPAQCDQFSSPETGRSSQQDKQPFTLPQLTQQALKFFRGEDVRIAKPLG